MPPVRFQDPELRALIEASQPMTDAERERQLVSFAYGNVKLENDRVTRAMVEEAARRSTRR